MSITRVPRIVPYNKVTLSDVFRGPSRPLVDDDPDAFISQDLEGEPWLRHAREFNIRGRTGSVRHLVRLLVSLHDAEPYLRAKRRYTGVLINHQEDGRLEEGQNGHEFCVAETDNNVRFVASPVSDLVDVRDRIVRLERLPHRNRLWDEDEQYRSKRAPRLLTRDHKVPGLQPVSVDDVLSRAHRVQKLHTAFVESFGSVLLWKEGGVEEEQERLRERIGKTIGLRVGWGEEREVLVARSLRAARPGTLSVYPNAENVDVVWKWEHKDDSRSAYAKLGKPTEGVTPVKLIF